ncbi:uncharacterized protein LOC144906709 [Branchiostoma floridae x Branchiostoma belcheri]
MVHTAHAYVIAVAMATQIMTGTLGLECLQCFATSLPSSSEAVDRCRNFTNPAEAEPCTDGNARYCFVQEKILTELLSSTEDALVLRLVRVVGKCRNQSLKAQTASFTATTFRAAIMPPAVRWRFTFVLLATSTC